MPKDPAIRQRRNKSASRALLPPETAPIQRAPRLPAKLGDDKKTWHPLTRRWWLDVWHSPQSHNFLRVDLGALLRLAILVDAFWSSADLALAREIRMMEREFGLTPLSRRRLEWTVAQAEDATERRERERVKRAKPAGPVVDVDPRGVLDK